MFFSQRGVKLGREFLDSFVNLLELDYMTLVVLVDEVGLFVTDCHAFQYLCFDIYDEICVCLDVQCDEIVFVCLFLLEIKVQFVAIVEEIFQ